LELGDVELLIILLILIFRFWKTQRIWKRN